MKHHQFMGSLWGAIAGDALGVPVEFLARVELARSPVKGMRGYGTHGQPLGTWSDDSSMILCTMEGLLDGWDLERIGSKFCRWIREGYWTPHGVVFDIGSGTARAIQKLQQGTVPIDAGGREIGNNGNGSLMRILPGCLYLCDAPREKACSDIDQLSCLTHAHPISRMSCVFYFLMCKNLISEQIVRQAWKTTIDEFQGYFERHPFRSELNNFEFICSKHFPDSSESEIASDGYVLNTLAASLWCLLSTKSYAECALKAVNLADDSDTTGCVAGGLAGLTYGYDSIPSEWIQALARREEIGELIESFWLSCGN